MIELTASSMVVAALIPRAILVSVPARGDKAPALSTAATHIAAEIIPRIPATTFRMLETMSIISEMAAMLLARVS
jgi:hypothetical protein